jgi:hypothetical protein
MIYLTDNCSYRSGRWHSVLSRVFRLFDQVLTRARVLRRVLGIVSVILALGCSNGFVVADDTTAARSEPADFDSDGVPDHLDLDQDNDGILNSDEGYVSSASLVDYPAQSYVLLPGAGDTFSEETSVDQTAGSVVRYPLLDNRGTPALDFVGTVLSTDTRIDWAVQQQLPKLRHQREGDSQIRWQFMRFGTDEQLTVDMDLTFSDLDGNRRESIAVNLDEVAGYSLSSDSNLQIDNSVAGKVIFTAGGTTDNTEKDAVVLHLRGASELNIHYSSAPNSNVLPGLDNNAAGFRHNFTASQLDSYVPAPVVRHSDNDAYPDHRDLDSNNDGLPDVDVALDRNQDGMLDGVADVAGVVSDQPALPAATGDTVTEDSLNEETAVNEVSVEELAVEDPAVEHPAAENPAARESAVQGSQTGDSLSGNASGQEETEIQFLPANDAPASATLNVISDVDSDSIADTVEGMQDADGDGVPNQYDLDSDNDGLSDLIEAGAADVDNNGVIDDLSGAVVKTYTTVVPDFDGDGLPDFLDTDSDQDGVFDLIEAGGEDADENGVIDSMVDHNGDGWDDRLMPDPLSDRDTDGDGSPDRLDSDNNSFAEPVVLEDFQQLPEPGLDSSIVTGGAAGCVLITGPQAVDPTLWLLLLVLHWCYLSRRFVPDCSRIIHESTR